MLDYFNERKVLCIVLIFLVPQIMLPWLLILFLYGYIKESRAEKKAAQKAQEKWKVERDAIKKIEKYDLVNPGGYDVLRNHCVFIAGATPPLPHTAYFVNGDVKGEINYIENDFTKERAELKHEYWDRDALYSYWRKIYDDEKQQFEAIDKVLLQNGEVAIDAKAFRKGKRFIRRDAECLASILYEEGYIVDYVNGAKIGLTLEEK